MSAIVNGRIARCLVSRTPLLKLYRNSVLRAIAHAYTIRKREGEGRFELSGQVEGRPFYSRQSKGSRRQQRLATRVLPPLYGDPPRDAIQQCGTHVVPPRSRREEEILSSSTNDALLLPSYGDDALRFAAISSLALQVFVTLQSSFSRGDFPVMHGLSRKQNSGCANRMTLR